ncbi:DUF4097 family beta strand repeat-containing protein [Alkalibacillus haloalkaliphilus]|uniref:DUF4097 family beta strand repeat-containing protein n=1 Tax=Alkalibacillus haloalkaliphilus TaxID=94136 RepID=UPI002935F8D9|nr:DUF4097 family beta strand repeat-containing protein [Alkalibacillus haloalkaliphilus]MDV2582869.1 DUF4097 family beta strand repeat-containing protein [Alkalibacillus haloalkaliphilus]
MSEKRRKILNLLEEGHITAEEADELLEALNYEEEYKTKEKSTEHNDDNPFTQGLKSVTDGIANFIDETVNMVKEGPFEFSFKHSNVKRTYHFNGDAVQSLKLNNKNGTVEFLRSNDDNIRIEVRGKVFKETDIKRAEALYDEAIETSISDNTLSIEQLRKDVTANFTVYLPKKKYDQVTVETFNGTIKVYTMFCNSSHISTVNGSVTLLDYRAETLSVSTRHGSIKLDDVAIRKAKLKTTTGSVHYDGTVEQINIDVTTGSVRTYVRNYDAKQADLSVSTGSLQLYVPKRMHINGTANTKISSVKVDLVDTSVEPLDDHGSSKSIQFYNVEEGDSYFDVDLSTKTGSVRVNNIS